MMVANEVPLPALPAITDYFLTKTDLVQMTVAANLGGIGVFAMVHGPLSDIYGRKHVLLYSLVIYVLVTLLCPFASSIYELIGLRFLQGCSGGATTVLGLAIVNDVFSGHKNTQILSRGLLATVVSRLISPIIGGYLTQELGWQYVFVFMAGYGLFCGLIIYFFYEETRILNTIHNHQGEFIKTKISQKLHQFFEGLLEMLKHKEFMYGVVIHSSLFCGKWIYSTVAPFVFIKSIGVSAIAYGYYSAAIIGVFILCSLFTQHRVHAIGNYGIVENGLAIAFIGTFILLILVLFFPNTPAWITMGAGLYIGATAMLGPAGATIAMDLTPNKGAAASIVSSSRTLVGVVGSLIGGLIQDNDLLMIPLLLFLTIALPSYMLMKLKTIPKKKL